MFEDKKLFCRDCGNEFIFTAGEQEFYAEKGFQNEPVRCKDCRNAKKSKFNENSSSKRNKEMYTAICAECGREAMVPFQPRMDKPVYCSDCFTNRK